jgi:hypothetical protein
MKWKIQLIAEGASGEKTEAEGKAILKCLQKRIVAAQVEHHGVSMKVCSNCGAAARTKGHYNPILRTVYGMCPCAFDDCERAVVLSSLRVDR